MHFYWLPLVQKGNEIPYMKENVYTFFYNGTAVSKNVEIFNVHQCIYNMKSVKLLTYCIITNYNLKNNSAFEASHTVRGYKLVFVFYSPTTVNPNVWLLFVSFYPPFINMSLTFSCHHSHRCRAEFIKSL